jgi:hypothetical protein
MAGPEQFFASGYPPRQHVGFMRGALRPETAIASGVASALNAIAAFKASYWEPRFASLAPLEPVASAPFAEPRTNRWRPSAVPDRTLYRAAAWATILGTLRLFGVV